MKKLLFISNDGMTDPLGQSQVIPYLKKLSAQGYHFTILSVEKKDKFEKNGSLIKQMLADAGIEWQTLFFTSSPPVLSKLYDQNRLNAKAKQLHSRKQFDFIHCRSYVAAAAALKLKKRTGVPFLFDMRGFWVDERVDSGLWNLANPLYNFFYKTYKKKEKTYFAGSAHIISLTEKGKQELVKNYNVSASKVTVIPCCADLAHFDFNRFTINQKGALRKEWNIEAGTKIISYLGSLGGWYMTDEMLDFYAVLRKQISNSRFLFITHDAKEKIIALAATKGIPADEILVKPASREQVPLFLSISNWSIFFIKDLYSKKASSPTKQGEIMGMGVPLICNDIGDTGIIVEETKTGAIVNGFNEQEYKSIVARLNELAEISKQHIRESAYEYYDLDKGVENYLLSYREVLK